MDGKNATNCTVDIGCSYTLQIWTMSAVAAAVASPPAPPPAVSALPPPPPSPPAGLVPVQAASVFFLPGDETHSVSQTFFSTVTSFASVNSAVTSWRGSAVATAGGVSGYFIQGNFSFAFPLAAWAFLGYSAPVSLLGSNDGVSFTPISTTAVAGAPICASPPSSIPCSYLVNTLPPASQPFFSIYRVVTQSSNYDYAATLFTPASPTARSLSLGSLATTSDGAPSAASAMAQPASSPAGATAAPLVWVAFAAGGAVVIVGAAAAAVALRRRLARNAAKANKIPATFVATPAAECALV